MHNTYGNPSLLIVNRLCLGQYPPKHLKRYFSQYKLLDIHLPHRGRDTTEEILQECSLCHCCSVKKAFRILYQIKFHICSCYHTKRKPLKATFNIRGFALIAICVTFAPNLSANSRTTLSFPSF